MTDGISELRDRLHSCEVAIEVHRGYLKATEYALRVLCTDPPGARAADRHLVTPTSQHRGEAQARWRRSLRRRI